MRSHVLQHVSCGLKGLIANLVHADRVTAITACHQCAACDAPMFVYMAQAYALLSAMAQLYTGGWTHIKKAAPHACHPLITLACERRKKGSDTALPSLATKLQEDHSTMLIVFRYPQPRHREGELWRKGGCREDCLALKLP